jgi:hypothetical protein
MVCSVSERSVETEMDAELRFGVSDGVEAGVRTEVCCTSDGDVSEFVDDDDLLICRADVERRADE